MIKKYTSEKISFETIIIPKGTLLFRGLSYGKHSKVSYLFNDFIGYSNNGRYSVAPTMNVFFYPVPYVGDVVNTLRPTDISNVGLSIADESFEMTHRPNVYAIYITQYDLELVLLVKPATISRKDTYESTTTPLIMCDRISENDKCGMKMSDIDPCFTDDILEKYPYINGYIALSETDAVIFRGKYNKLIDTKQYTKAKHIIPSILSDSDNIIGIPEIVIHPFYFRYNDCYTYGKNLRTAEQMTRYCINHRAQFNYFPFLYASNSDIYTFTDLMNTDILHKISKSERIYNKNSRIPVHDIIESVFENLLTTGYPIEGISYKAYIDNRTGFYTIILNNIRRYNKTYKTRNKKIQIRDNNDKYIYSDITYPLSSTTHDIINSSKYFDDMLLGLYREGYTIKKSYLFSKDNIDDFTIKFSIDSVFNRPELNKYKNIQNTIKNKTRRNIRPLCLQTAQRPAVNGHLKCPLA